MSKLYVSKIQQFLFVLLVIFVLIIGCNNIESPPDPQDIEPSASEPCAKPNAVVAGANLNKEDEDRDGLEPLELDGSGSTGINLMYEWFDGNSVLGTEAILNYDFPLGIHLITLTVTNDCGKIDKDALIVNVFSTPVICDTPTAEAGENINKEDEDCLELVELDGSGSTGINLEYEWFDGNSVLGTEAILNYDFPLGIHLITLTVTNDCGKIDKDAVIVNIFLPPLPCDLPTAVIAGENINKEDEDKDGLEPLELDGSGSAGNNLVYEWFDGNSVLGIEAILNYDFPLGIHLITLTVTNDCGKIDKDAVIVNILSDPNANIKPVASAGNDRTVLITEDVVLNGAGSYDPDGSYLNYLWTSTDDSIDFNPNNKSISPTVSMQIPGDYYFILVVNDGVKYSAPDIVKITVAQPDAWVDSLLDKDYLEELKFQTIQSAINNVSDETSKMIAIINGPYTENIIVKQKIHLIGITSQYGAVPQIKADVNESDAVVSLADSTTIENLHITGCSAPNDPRAVVRVIGKDVMIKRCLIKDSSNDGIRLNEENSELTIEDSTINLVWGEGIEAVSYDTITSKPSLIIRNCKFLITGGSAIWADYCKWVEIKNNIIYRAGWHGIHLGGCKTARVEHCTIIDCPVNVDPNWNQAGIYIWAGALSSIAVDSNLIKTKKIPTLCGVYFYDWHGSASFEYLYNYIYSEENEENNENYYCGDPNFTIEAVLPSNHPNRNSPITSDPLVIDPDNGDFRLDPKSPAFGLGKDETNPGALGPLL